MVIALVSVNSMKYKVGAVRSVLRPHIITDHISHT